MHPVLIEVGPITIYTYGFMIAIGAILGFTFMARQGKRELGISFDKANSLFFLLIVMGVVGGKLFLIFENPSYYLSNPAKLISSNGFVFYGSLICCIGAMLYFFRKNNIPTLAMLDIMAMVTCIVHGFGRIGCLMAGCCHGLPTDSFLGIIFTNPVCQARPLNQPLHPTQLYEVTLIWGTLAFLFFLRTRKKFHGQLFLVYLMIYGTGRSIIEIFRGDISRGYIVDGWITNSQFISFLMIATAAFFYVKLNRNGNLNSHT